jgi:DNA-binding transcriptional LysR family regulator
MDLDLRKLRYFAAVAELGHFGRAAEQLFIAQPVLSRQVRALENELGFPLLVRTTRSVQLTAAGRQLYEDAAGVLATAATATRRAREAASGLERLVVGFGPALPISAAVRAYAQVHPGVEVELVHLPWNDEAASLRDGRVDVGYIRRPSDKSGLRLILLGSEPLVACMPAGHPLAARRRITEADLLDEPLLDPKLRRMNSIEEKIELVAAGEGLSILPRSVARYYSRPDVVHRTIGDARPHELYLAIAEDRKQPHVLDFLDVAEQVLMNKSPRSAGGQRTATSSDAT